MFPKGIVTQRNIGGEKHNDRNESIEALLNRLRKDERIATVLNRIREEIEGFGDLRLVTDGDVPRPRAAKADLGSAERAKKAS